MTVRGEIESRFGGWARGTRMALAVAGIALAIGFRPSPAPAADPGPGSAVDPVAVAREVFDDPVFWWKRIETAHVSTSWLERIFLAIGEFLGKIAKFVVDWLVSLFKSLRGVFTGDLSAWKDVLLLLVLALIAWAVWRLYPWIVRLLGMASARRDEASGPEEPELVELPEWSLLFEQAGAAFRDGRHAEAIRLALLATIARLEQQGRLRYDSTRTNREYQRELRPTPELAARFGQLARIYDRAWYGRMPVGAVEAERALALCTSAIHAQEPAPE